MYKLIKMSAPGWERTYTTEQDVKEALEKHVCQSCLDDDGTDLESMLASSCGCEFWLERPQELPPTDAELIQAKFDGEKL